MEFLGVSTFLKLQSKVKSNTVDIFEEKPWTQSFSIFVVSSQYHYPRVSLLPISAILFFHLWWIMCKFCKAISVALSFICLCCADFSPTHVFSNVTQWAYTLHIRLEVILSLDSRSFHHRFTFSTEFNPLLSSASLPLQNNVVNLAADFSAIKELDSLSNEIVELQR